MIWSNLKNEKLLKRLICSRALLLFEIIWRLFEEYFRHSDYCSSKNWQIMKVLFVNHLSIIWTQTTWFIQVNKEEFATMSPKNCKIFNMYYFRKKLDCWWLIWDYLWIIWWLIWQRYCDSCNQNGSAWLTHAYCCLKEDAFLVCLLKESWWFWRSAGQFVLVCFKTAWRSMQYAMHTVSSVWLGRIQHHCGCVCK